MDILSNCCRATLVAGAFWSRSTCALALLASACVVDASGAEPADVVPAPAATLCPPPVEPAHETPLSPRGVYCTPSVVWEFGEGQVSLYHSTSGKLERGWVVRDDDRLAVAWYYACDGGELGDGVAVCEHVDSWPLVTTADSITVGGVTAVGEWAGGCDQ